MNVHKPLLSIAFESKQLSYSSLEVDLYNSGINQILSAAAARGHRLHHFSMQDLFMYKGRAYAKASVIDLPERWKGDLMECYTMLRKIDERPVPLSSIDLCFFRADDVRNSETPHLDIIQRIENHGILMESLEATLATNDKIESLYRCSRDMHPATYPASSLEEALDAVKRLPRKEPYFVLKDRYGFGCGLDVHRIEFADPELTQILLMYLHTYNNLIIQEYCSEIEKGDIVATFFDGELIGSMRRTAAAGEWKTNFSLGASQFPHTLTPVQEQTARYVQRSFSESRLLSVDMLESGKVLEVNAFPGGKGLLDLYGISLGNIVMDRMETEILGRAKPASGFTASVEAKLKNQWESIFFHYKKHAELTEVFDVFSNETYQLPIQELIELRSGNSDFILSVPHSGVLLPTAYTEHFSLDTKSLLEIDLFSNILYEALGGIQLISRLAPFFVDMNRKREGTKSGHVPKHLTNPPTESYNIKDEFMLKKEYTPSEKENILGYYDLYHDILTSLIQKQKREQGYALLIDGHSMTSVGLGRVYDTGEQRGNIVVGTLDDTSAHPDIISAFSNALRKSLEPYGLQLSVVKNEPYAGGFITRMHSDPEKDVHVIQVEVTMDMYMYEPLEEDKAKRYALKQSRLHILQDFLRQAVAAASDAAKRIYSG